MKKNTKVREKCRKKSKERKMIGKRRRRKK